MASYSQRKYCPNCKKNVSTDKTNHCNKCHTPTKLGNWFVRFRDDDGVQHSLDQNFKTKKEAQEAYITYCNKVVTRDNSKSDYSFYNLVVEYLKFKQTRLRESSYITELSKWRSHIIPFFKNFNISDIKPKAILEFQQYVDNYSYEYKDHMRIYLNSFFRYLNKYYDIPNIMTKIDRFVRPKIKKEMLFWSEDEFSSFILAVDDPMDKALFCALYFTGARVGEVEATYVKDWDLEHKTVTFNKSVTRKTNEGAWKITEPKNVYSIRTINLTDNFCAILREYIKTTNLSPNDFMFQGSRPISDKYAARRLAKYCAKAGVKRIRIHDIRHSHASFLIAHGVSIVGVAHRLGHHDVQQTLNTYSHFMKTDNNITLDCLEQLAI